MDLTSTFDELAQFTHNEKKLLKELGLEDDMGKEQKEKLLKPEQRTIDNILSYSRALSVRDSRIIGKIEMLNN